MAPVEDREKRVRDKSGKGKIGRDKKRMERSASENGRKRRNGKEIYKEEKIGVRSNGWKKR